MEIKASAGEIAYLMEEINRLSPVNIEETLEATDEREGGFSDFVNNT